MAWWHGYWHPWAWGWPWHGVPFGPAPYGAPWAAIPKEQEVAMSEEEARLLEGRLTEVRNRLEELRK